MTLATPLERHRARLKDAGQIRVEVVVPRDDAALVRNLAAILRDTTLADDLRRLLITKLGNPNARGFKALLESAPLEGIDLERQSDLPREIDL
ncbi:MAG: hypothetical protein CGW95_06125 [Phenylobacterium zucineum]|nr:MAG: hypothetical protein CGW95_06125 [Phenylobacterium zucineum]